MNRQRRKTDIAIIGMSGKFPKSENLNQFWQNLVAGEDLVHFYTEEELKESDVGAIAQQPNYVGSGCFLDHPDSFDHAFFEYTKEEATIMEPQTRVMHEQVWAALEDAAYNPHAYDGKIGLYLTASDNINWKAYEMMNRNGKVAPFVAARMADRTFISTIISYKLNLKGPSFYVDTACSSSLVAVHMACRSLMLKECSMAVAGGASINTTTQMGYLYEEGMVISNDGYCRAFDKDASGTIWGEGAGAVVLKRLDDAIKDRDNIYAVILASASNNDGRRKVGYTSPSIDGQYECISLAYRVAGVSPESVSYLEAHGTGTKLGDPIEVEALNKAFAYNKDQRCAIGSVKTNIGHLDVAAGISGLIKVGLAMKEKVLPPTLHFKQPNADIPFSEGPFYVNSALQEWNGTSPLRAGVSSFGIGGTNVHLVMEEAPQIPEGSHSRPYQLVTFSAKSNTALANYSKKITSYISHLADVKIADVAYSLNTGRQALPYRHFIVCQDQEEAAAQLASIEQAYLMNKEPLIPKANRKIVFMFSGQGSQYFQMGAEIYRQEPFFRSIMDQGFEFLQQKTGINYAAIIGFQEQDNAEANLINSTKYTQPLLFLLEYAFARFFMNLGMKPKFMLGHSLGEYTAACISGVFSFEDALTLLLKRADLMDQVAEGDMLSVRAPASKIRPLGGEHIDIAAINTDDTCVVSGGRKWIANLEEMLNEQEIEFVKLKTSHAFHSTMMDGILQEFEQAVEKIALSPPTIPYISNRTGLEIQDHEATAPTYWAKHLRSTVKFSKSLDYLVKQGDFIFIEIGPGKTLSSFLRQKKSKGSLTKVAQILRHPKEQINDNRFLMQCLGKLWSYGINLDWGAFYELEERRKLSLPTYTFDNFSFPAKVNPFKGLNEHTSVPGIPNGNSFPTLYRSNWKKSFDLLQEGTVDLGSSFLLFSEGTPFADLIREELYKQGNLVVEVKKGPKFEQQEEHQFVVNPSDEKSFAALFEALDAMALEIQQFVYAWSFGPATQESIMATCSTLSYLGVGLVRHAPLSDKKLTFIHDSGQAVLGFEELDCSSLAIQAMSDNFKPLYARLFVASIDIDLVSQNQELVEPIVKELKFNTSQNSVAYRRKQRWVPFFEQSETLDQTARQVLKPNQTYLITGDGGALELALATHLCESYSSTVLLVGPVLPTSPSWEDFANPTGAAKVLKKKQCSIFYYEGAISNYDILEKSLEVAEKVHGKIVGVIHAAGWSQQQAFEEEQQIDPAVIRKMVSPRIDGTLSIRRYFEERALDFVWIPTDLSSALHLGKNGIRCLGDAFVSAFTAANAGILQNWFCVAVDDSNGTQEAVLPHILGIFEQSLSTSPAGNLVFSLQNLNKINPRWNSNKKNAAVPSQNSNTERPLLDVQYVAPQNTQQEQLCEIWKTFFGFEKVGIEDDFFELGGDSLKAMSLLKRIQQQFDVEIGVQDFYTKPNIKELSKEIDLVLNLRHIQKSDQNSKRRTIKI